MPRKTNKITVTHEQMTRLVEFSQQHGANWKQTLRDMWMAGTDDSQKNGHLLRQVRNTVGPSGLDSIKLG